MSSPSLRPLIDTCQKCSTSPANHEPRSPANGSFQNPGVCPQAVPSLPSPTPTVLFLALAPFSAQAKYRKPRSSVFLCSQTLRKRLLRRLCHRYHICPPMFIFGDGVVFLRESYTLVWRNSYVSCIIWSSLCFWSSMYKFLSPLIVLVPQDFNLTLYAQVCWLCCVLYMPLFGLVRLGIVS